MKIFGFNNYVSKGSASLDAKKKWLWKPKRWNLIKSSKSLLNFNSTIEVFKAPQFSKGYTLILSKKNPNTGAILLELKKKGKPFLFLDWDEFVGEGVVHYNQSEKIYELKYKNQSFDLKKVKSIYAAYKEIEEVFFYQRSKFNNKEKVFLARWVETLRTLEFICDKAVWVPGKPSQMKFDSQNKFGELLLAQKMGLSIPKMVYTNDSRQAQKFLFEQKSILKESGLKFFEDAKNKLLFFDGKVVDPQDKTLSWIQTAPCMFQEYIEKDYEIRAIVVGKKVLGCKIDSQKHVEAKGDWRGQEHLVPFAAYKLPRVIEAKLLKFAKSLNFKLASFDLVKGKDGKYYFLEMNRPGQWYFIEILSGVPVTKTLVSIL